MGRFLSILVVTFLIHGCGDRGGNGEEDATDTTGDQIDTASDPAVEDGPVPEPECTLDEDCDDDDVCTTDTCDTDGLCVSGPVDEDDDGYSPETIGTTDCGGTDCDDTDDSFHPDAVEVCGDGLDQDCDDIVDGPIQVLDDTRVSTSDADCREARVVWTGSRFGIVWGEKSSSDTSFQMAILEVDGTTVSGPTDLVSYTDPAVRMNLPALAWSGSEFGLTWAARETVEETFFLRVDASGSPIGSPGVIFTSLTDSPSLVWTGSEYGLSYRAPATALAAFARIDPTGTVIGAPTTVSIAQVEYPGIEWTGSLFGAVWTENVVSTCTGTCDSHVTFKRIDPTGAEIGTALQVSDGTTPAVAPSLSWNGSAFGLAWINLTSSATTVSFARVDGDGSLVGTETELSSDVQSGARIDLVWNGSEYGVVWDAGPEPDTYLQFQHVATDGTTSGPRLDLATEDENSRVPSMAWTGSEFGIVWHDNRPVAGGAGNQTYLAKIGYCD